MKVVAEIELFKILKTKFTEAEAESIVANFENQIHSKFEEKKDEFATKRDLAELKSELIKWMFIFWVGSVGVLSGIMFAMLHAYLK